MKGLLSTFLISIAPSFMAEMNEQQIPRALALINYDSFDKVSRQPMNPWSYKIISTNLEYTQC